MPKSSRYFRRTASPEAAPGSRGRQDMRNMKLIVAVSAAVLAMAAPASAQVVLTVSAEQTTTWVRNFNPFGQTSARYTTLDFIYEPLLVFNRFNNGQPH